MLRTIIFTIAFGMLSFGVSAQTTQFTYQGKLTDNLSVASGAYHMQFSLWDAASGGNQVGATLVFDGTGSNPPAIQVEKGIFTVALDFNSPTPCPTCFNGSARWLQVAVKRPADPTYTTLPRQPLTSAPYAVTANNANTATNALQLGGVAANQYVTTATGGTNFIQNTTTPQSSSNFNISGNGTLGGTLSGNIVNAVTQFNIGGNRILSNAGGGNLFAGVGAGPNVTGTANSFFGANAGLNQALASNNSFFGANAGRSVLSFGNNSFFGANAGFSTTNGCCNAFFGTNAGQNNSNGQSNSFFGRNSGAGNISGSNNTLFGESANVGAGDLVWATAIGSGAVVNSSNTLVLGRTLDTVQIPGNLNVTGNLSPTDVLGRSRFRQNAGDTGGSNSAGFWLYQNTPATDRAFVGMESDNGVGFFGNNGGGWGLVMNTQTGFVGIGTPTPNAPLGFPATLSKKITLYPGGTGDAGFGVFGNELRIASDYSGADITFGYDNRTSGFVERMRIRGNGNVGIGTDAPSAKFHVSGTGIVRALINSDSNAGIGLGLNNQQMWSLATTPNNTLNFIGDLKLYNDYWGHPAIFIDGLNGGVRIGTTTTPVTEALEVQGRIRLGGGTLVTSGIESLKMIRGNVKFDGTILAGTGFTVTHNAAGQYTVDFSGNFPNGFTPVATINGFGFLDVTFNNQQMFVFTNNNIGISTDFNFSFIVVGN